jgi:hypothetical protein
LRFLKQIPEHPVKLCPFWRHWNKTLLRGTVLSKQIEGFYYFHGMTFPVSSPRLP